MGFLSVPAVSKLARDAFWERLPSVLRIQHRKNLDPRVTEKDVDRLHTVMNRCGARLRKLGFDVQTTGVLDAFTIYVELDWGNPKINRGFCMVYRTPESSYAIVTINMDRMQYGPVSTVLLECLLMHEIGHALGLVVTATESAENAQGVLNHCRHLTCAMTHVRLAGWFRLAVAWVISRGNRQYCKACCEYLKTMREKSVVTSQ